MRSPVVVPLQVVLNVADTAVQAPAGLSIPTVVVRKMAGMLPTMTGGAAVAVTVNVPELVLVQVPDRLVPPPCVLLI